MSDWITASGGGDAESWDEKEPIEGKYLSMKTGVGKFKSNVYTLKVGDKKMAVWGKKVIDDAFEDIPQGSLVRITPEGTKPMEGGNDLKLFDVKYKPPAEGEPTIDQTKEALGGAEEVKDEPKVDDIP